MIIFRILALVLTNLATLPLQICVILVLLLTKWSEEEENEIAEIGKEIRDTDWEWIKTGRFSKERA